uniref:Transmembrane protein 176B n=1 Tax=Poecilia reticulata TaxID=8081 RepID=A0A3P9PV37_POERE
MSVTMARNDGVTVFTVQSDPQSRWPPVCQILKSLCYSPLCCSVSPYVRKTQGKSYSVLGAMQIMIGLLNLGLGGTLRANPDTDWRLNESEFPYWLGALVMKLINVLTENFSLSCKLVMQVVLNVILNMAGVALAIAAIVLYSIYVSQLRFWWWSCSNSYKAYYNQTPPSQSDSEFFRQIRCENALWSDQVLLIGLNVVLIVLSIMELCVVISAVVLGIKTLRNSAQEENTNVENTKPLLEEVTSHSTA